MDELLQKLLSAEILSEETKTELESAFKKQIDEAVAAAKDNAAADVKAQLTEQWVVERDALIEALDSKVSELLEAEVNELKEDIERFRDLEAEYAEKLVEAKAQMADELKSDLSELVEKLDTFLELRIAAEMEELREDIEEVRKNDFGRRIFEAFAEEFITGYADEESAQTTVREMEERISDLESALEESEKKRKLVERKEAMAKVLKPLQGRSREVMEAILKNVETDKLNEAYKVFIGRVIRETEHDNNEVTENSGKEDRVLAESNNKEDTSGVIKTGDGEILEESADEKKVRFEHLRRLAGIA